jgi:hypothetical protein
MHTFKLSLKIRDDAHSNLPAFGFIYQDEFVSDPFLNQDRRTKVDPTKAYFISGKDARALVALNEMLDAATQDAINSGCFIAQKHLGITAGDFAGMHFSGPEHVYAVTKTMADYILREIERAADGYVD